MKFRTFATALLAGVFLASPVLAADQHFLADRHVAKGEMRVLSQSWSAQLQKRHAAELPQVSWRKL